MTINEKLTKEEHEKEGLNLINKIPSNNMLGCYLGTWAFSSEDANKAEEHLMIAGTPPAYIALAKMYEQSAVYSDTTDNSHGIVGGGYEHTSVDYTAYWAIRCYLKVGDEDQALRILERFGRYAVLLTVKNKDGKEDPTTNPFRDRFGLPDLNNFPRFKTKVYESLESIQKRLDEWERKEREKMERRENSFFWAMVDYLKS
ncbi:MAG: hypothetical protein V2A62_02115 [Candidatus Woesearchaeota archaeon]